MLFRHHGTVFLLITAAGPSIACSGKDSGTTNGEAGAHHILSGFNHTWNQLSHRVSLSEIHIDEEGTISSGIIGGDFSTGDVASDYVHFRVTQSKVSGEGLYVGHGAVDVVVGPDGVINETVTLAVPGISSAANVTSAFAGFRISSDTPQGSDYPSDYDPALGYTTKGWGFAIGEPSLSGDTVTVTVTGQHRWAPTNDEADPANRSDMNGAIPFAQSEVSVYFTVIGFEGQITTGSGTATVDYPNGNYSEQPPLTDSELGIRVETGGSGFPILRGFDLALEDQTSAEWGDYIRSYGVELAPTDPMGISTELTNSSLLEIAAIRFTPVVEVGWVQLSGSATIETLTTEGAHEIGSVSFAPDDPPLYAP